jgi:hypothetical protein
MTPYGNFVLNLERQLRSSQALHLGVPLPLFSRLYRVLQMFRRFFQPIKRDSSTHPQRFKVGATRLQEPGLRVQKVLPVHYGMALRWHRLQKGSKCMFHFQKGQQKFEGFSHLMKQANSTHQESFQGRESHSQVLASLCSVGYDHAT